MPIEIDRSTAADRPAILKLLREARGEDLSQTQRAQRGFVQGHLDDAALARRQEMPGVFIARDGAAIAGVALTALPGIVPEGPAAEMLKAAKAAFSAAGSPSREMFLYGPVAVARPYQGRGILTKLLLRVCTEFRDRFDLGVLFVEAINQKSLAIHRHYPMDETATFTWSGRPYIVFTFSPTRVLNHYQYPN